MTEIRQAYRYSMQDPINGCQENLFDGNIQEAYYNDRSEKYNPKQPEFNGWGSKFSQVLRFDVIIEEIRKNELYKCGDIPFKPNWNILDFGCGSGDLRQYLPKGTGYLGIDIREDVKGDSIYGGIDIFDEQFDKWLSQLFKPDYCIVSGSLAFMEVPQVEKVIDKLLEISGKGIVFNLLDGKSDYMGNENVVHVQRKRFFSYVFNKYRIGKKYEVRMRTDYFPDEDFTIGIFK